MPNGDGLPDNPFWNGSATANRSKIWAYGLRNPFRFDLKPGTNIPYIGDVGSNRFEELTSRRRASTSAGPATRETSNSGYANRPTCQTLYGQGAGAVRMPLYTYANDPSAAAPRSLAAASTRPRRIRASITARLFGDYSHGTIRYVTTDATDHLVSRRTDFASVTDFPGAIDLGPDGSIYYLPIYFGEIRRIRYTRASDTTPPSITAVSPPDGQSGVSTATSVTATFSEAMDPASTQHVQRHAYAPGDIVAGPGRCHLRRCQPGRHPRSGRRPDGRRGVRRHRQPGHPRPGRQPAGPGSPVDLHDRRTANRPPSLTITAPTSVQRFVVGDTVNFAATATDPEDGPLGGGQVAWRITLWHCPAFGSGCHPHPFQNVTGVGLVRLARARRRYVFRVGGDRH